MELLLDVTVSIVPEMELLSDVNVLSSIALDSLLPIVDPKSELLLLGPVVMSAHVTLSPV